MYAKIEPSGCYERHGNVVIRLAMYLEPGDARYNEHYVSIPVVPPEGYPGEVDALGSPVDRATYNAWVASLPHVMQLNPFHNHFIHGDPSITKAGIVALAEFHLANFYKAWSENKTIRSGWAVEHRVAPLRYDELYSPEMYALRKAQCEVRVKSIKKLELVVLPEGEGKTFPATAIDVGAGAIDRASALSVNSRTIIDYNNSANDTGTLDTFELWFNTTGSNVKTGTFYGTAPNFTSRDYETIGTVTAGSKQTFSGKDCDVTTGDWVGLYGQGSLEWNSSGFNGMYLDDGDQFGTGSQTYTLAAGDAISIYATGETPGWTGIVCGVTNPAAVNGVLVANISAVLGVA